VTRLLLIRHGETAHNADGRLSTAAPGGPLSEKGVEQAAQIAARLSSASLEAIYTSPLIRARQTAEAIAARAGLTAVVVDELAEISTGELDGRADEEAFDSLNLALDAWCQCDYTVRIGRDGEVGTVVCERFARVVEETVERHPRGTVALVSHGGLLQIGASSLCENLPPGFALRRFIGNTGVVELEAVGGKAWCVAWEETDPRELCEPEEGR
jgi:probable phosphoglycerate mutase